MIRARGVVVREAPVLKGGTQMHFCVLGQAQRVSGQASIEVSLKLLLFRQPSQTTRGWQETVFLTSILNVTAPHRPQRC
jgi:hypothetical protein